MLVNRSQSISILRDSVRMFVRTNLFLLIVSFAGSSLAQDDPIVVKPPTEFPKFREVLKGDQYTARFQKALQSVGDIRQLETEATPIVGRRMLSVVPKGQVGQQGVKPRDVVTKLDDMILWTPILPRRQDANQTLEFFSLESKTTRQFEVEPGMLGFKTAEHWRPDLVYVRGKSRSPKWDNAALVGAAYAELDFDLAETCWYHAIAQGYVPDAHAAGAGIALALGQGRVSEALAFAACARQADATRGEVVHPLLFYRAAVANYDLDEAFRVAKQFAYAFEFPAEALQALIGLHNSRDEAERKLAPPSVLALKMKRVDLTAKLVAFDDGGDQTYLPVLRQGKEFALEADLGERGAVQVAPPDPTRNFDVTARFKGQLKPGDDQGFFKELSVCLVDTDPDGRFYDVDGRGNGTLLSCKLREGTTVSLAHSTIPTAFTYSDPSLKIDMKTEHEVRMIRVGGQAELFLNGHRVLYIPLESTNEQVCFEFKIVGAKGVLQKLTFEELIPAP